MQVVCDPGERNSASFIVLSLEDDMTISYRFRSFSGAEYVRAVAAHRRRAAGACLVFFLFFQFFFARRAVPVTHGFAPFAASALRFPFDLTPNLQSIGRFNQFNGVNADANERAESFTPGTQHLADALSQAAAEVANAVDARAKAAIYARLRVAEVAAKMRAASHEYQLQHHSSARIQFAKRRYFDNILATILAMCDRLGACGV